MPVDIVVSFDTTGSMMPALAEVRRKVAQFITTLFEQVPDLQMGVITHGDYVDGPMLITSHELTTDRDALVRFVQTAPQTSGGDADEAYEYVLKFARETYNWRSDAKKAFVLIADAKPHGVGYRYERGSWNGRQYNDLNWYDEAYQLVQSGVSIYPIQALNHYGSTSFYKGLSELSGTPKLDLHQFSNVIPILTAVIFAQQDTNLVQQYSQQLEESGQLNRNIASDIVTGKQIGRAHV